MTISLLTPTSVRAQTFSAPRTTRGTQHQKPHSSLSSPYLFVHAACQPHTSIDTAHAARSEQVASDNVAMKDGRVPASSIARSTKRGCLSMFNASPRLLVLPPLISSPNGTLAMSFLSANRRTSLSGMLGRAAYISGLLGLQDTCAYRLSRRKERAIDECILRLGQYVWFWFGWSCGISERRDG
jgi:hypothetical protein